MKTLFLLIFILSISTLCYPQNNDIRETFIDLLSEECNGYIDGKTMEGITYTTTINIPSYYNFDLVRMNVKILINEYSDVQLASPWKSLITNDGYKFISCGIRVNEKLMLINYSVKLNIIITFYKKDNDFL